MVTPRKVYTPERRAFLLNNALRIVRAYKRKPETVQFPVYFGDCELGPLRAFSEQRLVLFKLHYKQLQYTLRCLGWPLKLEYAVLADKLNKLAARHEKGVVFIEISESGKVVLEVSTDVPEFTLAGLVDHLNLLTSDPDEETDDSETYFTELGCIEVCIDTEPSTPCFSTTHWLKDKHVFDEAETRVQKVETGYKSTDEPTLLQLELEIDESARIQTFLEEDCVPTKLPLVYNPMQQVMNAGEATVAFFRNGVWCTPHASTGCRLDPLRTALLKYQILEEAVISVQNLSEFEDCLLISAHHGVLRGIVTGNKPEVLSKVGRKRRARPVVKEAPYISESEAKKRSVQAQNMWGKTIPGTGVFRI